MTISISVVGQSVTENEDYKLERLATAKKNAGDIEGAIDCLKKAQAIRGPLGGETRLAKFLQQAGRFDEAMQEIQNLVADSNSWAEGNFDHQPRSVRRHLQAGRLAEIHHDAALICRREEDSEREAYHDAEAVRWNSLRDQLQPLAEADKRKRREARAS